MITGNELHNITLAEAAKLTKNFRTIIAPLVGGVKSEAFGKNALLEVLNQPGAVGIRIYFGLSTDIVPLPQQVIVGIDVNGNDMVEGRLVEDGLLCPPSCPSVNVLNSNLF